MREKVRSFTAAAYAGSTVIERVMKFAFNRKNGYLLGDYGQKIYEQTMALAFFREFYYANEVAGRFF